MHFPRGADLGGSDTGLPRMGARCCVLAVLVALGAFAAPAGAQVQNVRSYGSIDGLPQVQIMAAHQDRLGYLWFGTYGGLTRYDGGAFQTITTQDGLTSNAVFDIVELDGDTLVVGTIGGGLCWVHGGRPVDCLDSGDGLPHDEVRDVERGPDGSVWAATERGVSRIVGRRIVRSWGEANGLPPAELRSVVVDVAGRVWVGAVGGLFRLDGGRFVADPLDVGLGREVEFLVSSRGRLLVGVDGEAFEVRGDRAYPLGLGSLPDGTRLTDAAVDENGAVWISTRRGVVRTDAETETRIDVDTGLPTEEVNRVLVDREGNVWLGTENGASKLVPGPLSLWTESQGLPNPFVRAITEAPDGTLWAGTRAGLAQWIGDRFVPIPLADVEPRVYALVTDAEGGLLIGTSEGLFRRTPDGLEHFGVEDGLPHDFVMSMARTPDDRVWIGTAAGLAEWRDGGPVPVFTHEVPDAVTAMASDDAGRIWAGLRIGGLVVVEGDRLRRLGAADGFSDQSIWSISPSPDGGVWVGTNGDGAFHLAGDSIRRVDGADGLIDPFVWQVVSDRHGGVWFYTSAGLDRLADGKIRHYGIGDGLTDLEGTAGAAMESSDGVLWFGSGSGVYRYRRELESSAATRPPIFIEALESNEGSLDLADAVIEPGSGFVRLRVSSPSFRDEAGTRFRWRLAGADSTWSPPTGEGTISLAGLSPGGYTVEVVAEDRHGARSARPAAVELTVLPRLWQTPAFRIAAFLAVVLVAGFMPYLRARHLERERRRLNRLVDRHTHELREKTRRLEEEVSERERTEEQLRQSQKMEAVGRLAGGVAHDFNNLLTAVIGHADLAATDLDPDHPIQDDLAQVRHAAQRGAGLVDQLLAFGRRQIVRSEVVDVNTAVTQSSRMVSRMIGEDVRLTVTCDPEPAPVTIDPHHLDQVIVNLVVNARDAMPKGGELRVRVKAIEVTETLEEYGPDVVQPGDWVLLEVADEGVGMKPEILANAFEPFFTTKDIGEGSGLGLATVYGTVKQHGGAIQVRNRPEGGVLFRIYLPRSSEPVSVEPEEQPIDVADLRPTRGVVLVVEDEASVRRIVCRVLTQSGIDVLVSDGPDAAYSLWTENRARIDLVLTDVVMPGGSGLELAERIASVDPAVPVVFMSGYPDGALGAHGALNPELSLLPKPFSRAALLDHVSKALEVSAN